MENWRQLLFHAPEQEKCGSNQRNAENCRIFYLNTPKIGLLRRLIIQFV